MDSPVSVLAWAMRARALTRKSSAAHAEGWLASNGAPAAAVRLYKSSSINLGDYGGPSISAWAESLSPKSCFYRILSDGSFVRAPLGSRVAVTIVPAVGFVTNEGDAMTLSAVSVTSVLLEPRKACSLITCSNETLFDISAAGQRHLHADLAVAVSTAVDAGFLDLLTDSGTTVIATSGTTAAAAWADLRAGLLAVTASGPGRVYLIAAPDVAVKLSTVATSDGAQAFAAAGLSGGEAANLPLLVSSGAPAGSLFVLNASSVCADASPIVPDETDQADILMQTVPMNSTTPTPASLVSMWQTNSVALASRAVFGAMRLRDDCIAEITNINYGGGTP